MNTLQGMMMRTNYMIEEIRRSAIDETIEKFKQAARHYYETSDGGADTTNISTNWKSSALIWNTLLTLICRSAMRSVACKGRD